MKRTIIALVVFFTVFAVIFLLFLRQGQFWDGVSRFRVILGSPEGAVTYALFDPKRDEIRLYPLNPNTEVEASFDLGSWKVGSLWKLGEQEKKGGGEMLSQSLDRGMGLPIEGYMEYSGPVEAFNLARHLIFGRNTDLFLRDRLMLAWFSLRAKITVQSEITPTSIIITAEELNTVTDGIVTVSKTESVTDSQAKAVSVLVSNLGGKVLDFSTLQEQTDQYCSVSGKSIFSQKLAHVLKCSYVLNNSETTLLNLGEAFAKNF